MKFKKLKEKRMLLQTKIKELIDKADSENRAMNEDEASQFDEMEKEIQDIDKTIAMDERARRLQPVDDNTNAKNDGGDDEQKKKDYEKAEERAFADFLRGKVEERAEGDGGAGTGMDAGNGTSMQYTDNGAVIPSNIANKIIQKTVDICPIFADSEHYNVKGSLSIPYYDEKTGDIAMEYCDEFTEGESTSGKFASISLNGFLARAITEVSKSLINNSQFDIVSFVISKMAEQIARFLEKELLFGTTGKAEGLSGVKLIKEAAAAAAVTSDELIDLQEMVPDKYQGAAYWIMNKATRTEIRKMKDGQGNYLLNKDATSRWGYTLFGKDVYTSDNMPRMAAGKIAVFYGDMKGLAVKISEDINIEVLRETGARRHIIEVLGFVEFDAKIQNAEMIAALKMKG